MKNIFKQAKQLINPIDLFFKNNINEFKLVCEHAKLLLEQSTDMGWVFRLSNPSYYCIMNQLSEEIVTFKVKYKNVELFTIIIWVNNPAMSNYDNRLRIYTYDDKELLFEFKKGYTEYFYDNHSPENEFNKIVLSFLKSLLKKFNVKYKIYIEQEEYNKNELKKQKELKEKRREESYKELLNELK